MDCSVRIPQASGPFTFRTHLKFSVLIRFAGHGSSASDSSLSNCWRGINCAVGVRSSQFQIWPHEMSVRFRRQREQIYKRELESSAAGDWTAHVRRSGSHCPHDADKKCTDGSLQGRFRRRTVTWHSRSCTYGWLSQKYGSISSLVFADVLFCSVLFCL